MKRFILAIFLSTVGFADAVEFLEEGPIHEAFITQEFGGVILQAVPYRPPADLTEQIPERPNEHVQWIHGYWEWSKFKGDFIWISGVWRRPPPDHRWVSGKWAQLEEGWVWIKGFWSPFHKTEMTYISQPPPDMIDESVSKSPGKSYFWISGYWQFDEEVSDYVWHRGRWQLISESWQYVPTHYLWGEKGYFMIPGYWDWPLEEKGVAYAAAYVEPDRRESVVYEPSVILEPLFICESLYPYWPNYPNFFYHHYYYHFDIWLAWGAVPPWWHWDAWWTFSWQDSWWLFWWWANPGFPQPFFIDEMMAQTITAPPLFVLKLMQNQEQPFAIAENGAIGTRTLIDAIESVTGHTSPILPSDPKIVNQIHEVAYPKGPPSLIFRPSGQSFVRDDPSKPYFGPVRHWLDHPPGRAAIPSYPKIAPKEVEKPPIVIMKPKRPPTYREPPKNSSQEVHYTPSATHYKSYEDEKRYRPKHPTTQSRSNSQREPRPSYPAQKAPRASTPQSTYQPKIRTYNTKPYRSTRAPSSAPMQGSPRETQTYTPMHLDES
ncbi:MAG: hypothetical protein S4CHLAM45_06930 [Chlamydiales bacterium]|nr:hypothetical protein [Chlamydiales bacterium]MCH9620289.1 hypothetical protein [Chlamydiales bacterium]MCH9622800.1 hypothetical protein [Chlamydiales bacterium]